MTAIMRAPRRMTQPPQRSAHASRLRQDFGVARRSAKREGGNLRIGRSLHLAGSGADTDRKAASPCGRELEVLAVVLVSEILDRKDQAELLAAAGQRHAPAEPLHGEAV